MKRSPYSVALNKIFNNREITVGQFMDANVVENGKAVLEDLYQMGMINIVDDKLLVTKRGYNSMSVESR
jgi:hypothetical protein